MEKILLIDDLEDNLIALNAIIKDEFAEINVITAHDGATGIELARIHNPNIIMLDILMPMLDGFEVCRILKNDVNTSDIPVVFVTALKENRENKIRALQAGAEGFLAKPIDNIELVALVKTMLKIKAANISLKEDKKLLEQIVYARTIELKESEEKHWALYENAPLPYQSLDEDGSFRDVNPAWLNLLGYKREEVIGKFYIDFLHPDYRAHFEKNFPAFKKRGYVHDVQFKFRHKEGHYLHISFEGCVGYFPDGRFKQTYCVFQDITERKHAEAKLIQSEEKYRMFIDLAVDAFFQGDANGDFIEVNNAAVELTGYSRVELLRMNMKDLFSKELLIQKPLRYELLLKGQAISTEREIIRKDGRSVFVEMNSKKQTDGTFQSFFKDITARKSALDALKESEEKYEKAFLTSPYAITITNVKDGKFIEVNDAFTTITGYTREDALADSAIGLKLWVDPQQRKDVIASLLNGEVIKRKEVKFRKKNGEIIYGIFSSSIINLNNNHYI
ncbi:MAG: PAS domain S-box protein, partial [Ignavibacteria bacterium]|nr:PAS domain S-box protein [Ignavibacteria bacterium]